MNDLAGEPRQSLNLVKGFLPPVELAPGDRFPNFILPDQSGAARFFLERAKGYPALIIGDSDDSGLKALEQAGLSEAGVDAFALVSELPEAAQSRAERLGLGFPLLC